MRNILVGIAFVAIAVLGLSIASDAATGLTPDLVGAGAGLDWLSSNTLDQQQIVPLQIQYAYNFKVNYNTTIVTSHRILAAPGSEAEPTAYVNEFSALAAYDIARGFNIFAGPCMSTWGKAITGSPQELYGGLGGFSFPLEESVRMVVGYRHLIGKNGLLQNGIVFGPAFAL
jgi:hypothetical protein